MKKEVTFNTSFRASTSRNIATEVPLQFAAVCNRFTLAQLREQLAATGYPWKEDDDALIKKYTYYTSKDDKYCLKEYERNLILRALAPSGIRELLSRMNEGYRNDLIQVMFEKYVTDSAPTLDRQSMEELAATYTVAAWLKNCGINIPAEPIILANIKQRELLQPFVELTECFAGRQDKLAELSDYVDWLPKSSLVGSITSGFRNIINWHDKAPMMITGIGGVGKSTLVAKFILDQINYQKNQKLPFIYFDFDKPGLSVSNPIELAVDAFRQLALLFPESEQIFTEIRDHLVEEFIEKEEKSNIEYATQSRGSDRSVIYEKYAKQFSKEIAAIKRPVLVVLDSFEEIQYRASPAELNNLFSFIREVSNIIPRLRPVFVGRAEAKYSGIEFDLLQLADFDQAAAEAFLYARGITDKKLQSSIYSKLGGQPLTLQLAANLVEKEKIKSTAEIEKIGSLLDETLIQEVLVKRNLQHTHGGNAEKIAIPGILMRKINPDIIQKVLADPCGFKDLTKTEAETIFEDLKKESFLIASTGADIKFRANLRIALYDLIMKKPEYHGREVHDRAVDYYKDKPNPEDKAEYLYHRLMRGDDPATIESVYSGEVRPYIESSLSELPTSAFVYLATLMGIRVSADKVEQSGLQQWEEYQISQIIDLLKKGDEISLKKICDELSSRPERTYDSPLNYYEAKVLIRLASFKKAETILNKAIAESLGAGNNLRQLNLQVLKSDLYEYQLDFHKAFDTISAAPLLETVKQYMSSSIVGDIESLISGRLAWSRLAKRMGEEHYVSMTEKLYSFIEPFQEIIYGKLKEMAGVSSLSGILPFPYKTYAERLYRYKSDINFRSLFAEMDNSFSNENEFRSMLQRLEKSVTNKLGLEKFLQSRYSLNLKDICEPGSLKINLIDVVKYMELDRNNESSQKNSTKLTGAQINRLIEAILNSFNQHELELILYTRLDKRLLNLMPTHASFHMQVFTLITEAVKNGWDEQLITALLAERPANVELHQIASQRGIA